MDVDFFQPLDLPKAAHPTLVFTGQMDYFANVDGVVHFARQVFPRLRARYPELELLIVGRAPVAAVRDLGELPGVQVTGAVGDVRPFLARAWVFVAPLRIAQGVQNKVLEAIASNLPVVCSERVLAGLADGGFRSGRDLLAAASDEGMERAIATLIDDEGSASAWPSPRASGCSPPTAGRPTWRASRIWSRRRRARRRAHPCRRRDPGREGEETPCPRHYRRPRRGGRGVRDLIIVALVFASLPVIVFRPYFGLLVYGWLAYMRPQDMAWGRPAASSRCRRWWRSRWCWGLVVSLGRERWLVLKVQTVLLILLAGWISITVVTAVLPEVSGVMYGYRTGRRS